MRARTARSPPRAAASAGSGARPRPRASRSARRPASARWRRRWRTTAGTRRRRAAPRRPSPRARSRAGAPPSPASPYWDRGDDRLERGVVPRALRGEPEVQATGGPAQLAHRPQGGLRVGQRGASPGDAGALLDRPAVRHLARRGRLAAGVERQPTGGAGARVVEVPRDLRPRADLGELDPARERQRGLRQGERAPEERVGGGDALERLMHWTIDPTH